MSNQMHVVSGPELSIFVSALIRGLLKETPPQVVHGLVAASVPVAVDALITQPTFVIELKNRLFEAIQDARYDLNPVTGRRLFRAYERWLALVLFLEEAIAGYLGSQPRILELCTLHDLTNLPQGLHRDVRVLSEDCFLQDRAGFTAMIQEEAERWPIMSRRQLCSCVVLN